MLDDGHDFSFSGLKTAVVQYVRKHPEAEVADVAASFQAAVVDVLVDKLLRAAARDRRSTPSSSAAASPPTRRCAARLLDRRRDRAACGSCCPASRCAPTTRPWSAAVAAYRLAADGPTPLDAASTPTCAWLPDWSGLVGACPAAPSRYG